MAANKRTIVLTRPWESSVRLQEQLLSELGGTVKIVLSPLLETIHLETAVDLTRFGTIVFSSANGVKALTGNRPARKAVAYCVGDQTSAAAAAEGYRSISANGSAIELAELVARRWKGEKMVYVCGRTTSFDLQSYLSERRIPIEVAILYEQKPLQFNSDAKAVASEDSCVFSVYSARSGSIFAREAKSFRNNTHVVVCMSHSIAMEVSPLRWKTAVAQRPDSKSMRDLIARWHLTEKNQKNVPNSCAK